MPYALPYMDSLAEEKSSIVIFDSNYNDFCTPIDNLYLRNTSIGNPSV